MGLMWKTIKVGKEKLKNDLWVSSSSEGVDSGSTKQYREHRWRDQVKRKIRKLVNTCWVEGAQWKWQVV